MSDSALYKRARFITAKQTLQVLLLGCALSWGGASSTTLAQYRFDILNTDNGLPQNSIHSILQSRDGHIWFATFDGLVRYDGVRYTIFNTANSEGINSNRFLYLYEDQDGSLWASTEDGGLTHYKDNQFHTYTTADGLPHTLVGTVRRTADGTLLAMTAGGLARLQGERFEVISTEKNSFDSEIGIQGQSGNIWYRIGAELRRIRDGKVTSYVVPGGRQQLLISPQLYEDREGRLWIGNYLDPKAGLWMLKDEVMTRYGTRDGLPPSAVISFCEDREGTIWLGTDKDGLVRFKDGKFTTYTTAQGLSSNSIETIFEDREGTLWVGTRDNGITRITRQVITTLSEKDGLKGKIFYPIIEDHTGNIWIGNAGVNRIKDGKFIYYPLNLTPQYARDNHPQAEVRSFYEDRQEQLWIGHSYGVYRFQNEAFTDDKQMASKEAPYAIFQDSRGAFWFGYGNLLIRYHNGEAKQFTLKDGLHDFVQPIYEDRQGRIWIGSYGGLAQYVDDHLVFLTEKDGLSSNRVRAIYEDADGVLWIGTYDGGLNRFKDGKFTSYTTRNGMFSNGVFAILEDRHDNFWMSSNQGIHRVRRQQLNDFADGKVSSIDAVSYGKADGMLSTECNGARHPSAIKTRDGRMWFPTFDGVAIVDPEAVAFNDVPPPVVIENVNLDREDLDARLPVEIYPGKDNLEIQYSGLSFIKSEHLRFKYRLEGLHEDWVDAGNRRAAYFTHLPPGEYVFHVIAANSDGVWNQEGVTLRIIVIPSFWQKPWFVVLVTLSLASMIVLFFRVRIRNLQRANTAQEAFSRRLLESQEGERKRIAAELHDSLGQNLLIIKNRALMGLNPQDSPGIMREQLDEISVISSQAIDEIREIAYNLQPYQMERIGLSRSIESMIKKVAISSGIAFSMEIDQLKGVLSRDAEINFYRIVQECINNIVKHANARKAEISIIRNNQNIQLSVKDNGKGFAIEQTSAASETGRPGFGLAGIAERVRILGGIYELQSTEGRGTTVSITIAIKEKQSEQ